MTNLETILIIISILGIIMISIRYAIRNGKIGFLLGSLIICIILIIILYNYWALPEFLNDIPSKGVENDEDNLFFVIFLYICMLLGIISHYLFDRFQIPKMNRRSIDFGIFFAPIFVSPMIFLPLYAAFHENNVDFHGLSSSSLTVYFIAFENGFFWREIFNNRLNKK